MPNKNSHIILLCSRLDLPGGIERAIVNTANLLDKKDYKVTLIILDSTATSFYPIQKGIAIIQQALDFGITEKGNFISRKVSFLQHISALKTILKKVDPDIIIGTEYSFSITAYLASRGSKVKVLAWEHHHFYWLRKSIFWKFFFSKVYPKLHSVICLNNEEASLYKTMGCTTSVIPNFIERTIQKKVPGKNILSVGWLIKRKGIDLVPAIAEKIFLRYPEWKWKIIGTGDEESWLKKEIEKRHLENNVFIQTPASFDLSASYSEAAIYAMPSRFECFPMVLLEAMSFGVPCISFDCPTGPAFIIEDKVNGLLVKNGDANAMAGALIDLISNEEKRTRLGINAYQNIQRFSPDKIAALWKAVFELED